MRPTLRRTSWQRDLAWLVGTLTLASAFVLVWTVTLWRASDETRGPQVLAAAIEYELAQAEPPPNGGVLPEGRPFQRAVEASAADALPALQQAARALTERQGREGWADPHPWFGSEWVENAVGLVVASELDRNVAAWWRGANLRADEGAGAVIAVGVRDTLPWNPTDENPSVGAYRALIERMVDTYLTTGRTEAAQIATSVPLRARILQGLNDAERTLAALYTATPNPLQETVAFERRKGTLRAVLTGGARTAADRETHANDIWANGLPSEFERLNEEGLSLSSATQFAVTNFDRTAHDTWQRAAVTSGLLTLTGLVLLVLLGRGAGRLIRAGLPLTVAGTPGVLFAAHALLAPSRSLPTWLPYRDVTTAARSWMLNVDGAAWEVAWVHAVLLAAGLVLIVAGLAVWLRGSGRPN